mmetsp:Transcript_25454/g.57414  ORF Transcript_25454/g.57414 Transcript_25454/m.57414 type:complete len:441 (+) Transcript_25454:152-1474(+)
MPLTTEKKVQGAEEIGESGLPLPNNDHANAAAGVEEGLASAAAAAPAPHEGLSSSSVELLNQARSELNRLRNAGLDSGAFKYSLMGIVGDHFHNERDFNAKLSSLISSRDIKFPPKPKQRKPGAKSEGTGKQAEQWEAKYQLLLAYKNEHGTPNAPKRHAELGKWIQQQRGNYKKGKILESRKKKLEDAGFSWSVQTTPPVDWDVRYNKLIAYKNEHGTTNVPARHPELGTFVQIQRKRARENKLSEERKAALERIDFDFGTTRGPLVSWEHRFEELKEYKAWKNTCNVPVKYEANPPLGEWVAKQRKNFKAGKLAQERFDALEAIGFNWGYREMSWENRFERLKQFCEDAGHSKVPQSHPELGTFVMTQRRLYKQGKLLEERQRLLEGINFQWVVYQKSGLKSDTDYEEELSMPMMPMELADAVAAEDAEPEAEETAGI